MKNTWFGKATALAIGSLVIFSGQALAFSPNHKELTNAKALGESELIVAQANVPVAIQNKIKLSIAVGEAYTAVGNAAAIVNAADIPQKEKVAIANLVAKANIIIGDASAVLKSTAFTKDDAAAIADSLRHSQTPLYDALAIAESLPDSPDKKFIVNTLMEAIRATEVDKSMDWIWIAK